MIDDEDKGVSHTKSLSVKGVLYTLEQFNDSADGQDRRLAHWFSQPQVKCEKSLDHATHAVGQ